MKSEARTGTDHSGHRQRMLESYLSAGLDGFSEVQTLEFLLGYAVVRKDVNPLAHALLEEFGSLSRVLSAPLDRLLRVPGVGPRTAALLRLVPELWQRCEIGQKEKSLYLRSTGEIGRYLAARSVGLREERAWLLSLDAGCRFLECRELCRGAVNAVNLPYRKVVEAALLANASSVVLAHNHTSGVLLPSVEDLEFTRGLKHALELVDVLLADHMLLSGGNYLSMRASSMLEP